MLARALEATFSPAERDLATLLSAGLTQTNVATALGISYGAARVRIHRLRRRMWTDAADVAAALPPAERAEVHRFLRRAGGGDSSAAHSTMDLHVERDSTAAAWMSDGSGDAPSGHHSPSSTSDVTGAPATRPRPLERPT
jgi:hypothetical protein